MPKVDFWECKPPREHPLKDENLERILGHLARGSGEGAKRWATNDMEFPLWSGLGGGP